MGLSLCAAARQQEHDQTKELFGNKSLTKDISKNDIIVADQSGVVCVPESKINKILELLKKISKQEDILEDQVLRNVVQNWDEL